MRHDAENQWVKPMGYIAHYLHGYQAAEVQSSDTGWCARDKNIFGSSVPPGLCI